MLNIARNKQTFMQSVKYESDYAFLPEYATDDHIDISTDQVSILNKVERVYNNYCHNRKIIRVCDER